MSQTEELSIGPLRLDELAPGVAGYTFDREADGLYVPLVAALRPGHGAVGRYLDILPRDRRVVFPNVISPVLEGMLQRRGFTLIEEWSEDYEAMVPCWHRLPEVSS
jgi:hypothetical protein